MGLFSRKKPGTSPKCPQCNKNDKVGSAGYGDRLYCKRCKRIFS